MARKFIVALALLAFAASPAAAFGTLCGDNANIERLAFPEPTEMPANLKVAMFGDAGAASGQRDVLEMVKAFGADFAIHLGDFDYQSDPELFEQNIADVLGDDFPYFVAVGNHDMDAWKRSGGYAERMWAQLERANASQFCEGEYGVKSACYYKGLYFVLSGVGTMGANHPEYITEAFAAQPAIWRVCGWHKNQRLYQTGGKSNEVGYAAYDACREAGAIVATGHEHSYARSYLMSNFEDQTVASFDETLRMSEGRSFVFCSGLGGNSVREWEDDLNENEWWAACAAADNNAKDGPLLCTFNVDGDARRAHCIFQDSDGVVFDEFDIISDLDNSTISSFNVRPACTRSSFIETPITEGANDVAYVNGVVATGEEIVSVGEGQTIALRFTGVQVQANADVMNAHFQVKGRSTHEKITPQLTVRVELTANSAPLDEMTLEARTFSAPLSWTSTGEDWEEGAVWVSVDFADAISSIVRLPSWEAGNAITVVIGGVSEEGAVRFSSFDQSACMSPTLAVEVAPSC